LHPNASSAATTTGAADTALQALARDHRAALDARERLGFLINWEALLHAGQVHGDEYLTTVTQFADDPQPLVVDQAMKALKGSRMRS